MKLTTNEINYLVDQYVHNAKHRRIMKYRLIDGSTYEEIAEKEKMCDRQIGNIVRSYMDLVMIISC